MMKPGAFGSRDFLIYYFLFIINYSFDTQRLL